jgi:hypothetical protein
MTHSIPMPPLAWKRHGKIWQLTHGERVLAFAEPSFASWLCYTTEDNGDDGLLGPLPTLAAQRPISNAM